MQAKKRDDSDKKAVRFGKLLERINNARGQMPLGTWVKIACNEKLERESK